MAEGGSSSWGALRGRASQPTTLTPDEKGGREGLLAFVNITKEVQKWTTATQPTCTNTILLVA